MRIAFLGPPGTFAEEALKDALGDTEADLVPVPTVYDAILAVDDGDVDRALVPVENSIEGAVTATLDTLALDATSVKIVGARDHPIHLNLIAREELSLGDVTAVLSHPQPIGQCARFIREHLPGAEVRSAPSTADAVRQVVESPAPWVALGAAAAAELYGATVLREGVEDGSDNVTRFVWIAPEGTRLHGDGPWRTSLVFAELGEDHPGALVEALLEFSSREVNLTRIESRPLRQGLGRYMFFIDLEGGIEDAVVAEAIDALRGKAESVRILGSYPVQSPAPWR